MKCDKCHLDFIIIEEHHLLPKYMDNPHGYIIGDRPSRVVLCPEHHKELHRDVLTKLLQDITGKDNIIDHVLWRYVYEKDKERVKRLAINETLKWLKEEDDTKTITQP